MLQTTWIALVLGLWSSLYLIDVFLKGKKAVARPYLSFLDKTGLNISICQLRWYTTIFNRAFLRIGQWRPSFLRAWFTVGVFFSLLSMVASVFLLSLLVLNTVRQNPVEQQVLTPVMPGVNLPMSQISYYMLTLLVCGILHEVGHALAAVREQVRVNGFGLFLLLIYPGAFVDLSTEHLQAVSPLRQLRIYCAGVWHNLVIALLAGLVLLALPSLLLPFYTIGSSVVVTEVVPNSAVSGPRGLSVGEAVTRINDCHIKSIADWSACLTSSMQEKWTGHCLPLDLIKEMDTSPLNVLSNKSHHQWEVIDCCNSTSATHLCFMYHTKKSAETKYACLPARHATDRPMCRLQSDCYVPKIEAACVYPAVDNETKLLRVFHGQRPPLLFLGYPLDLYYSVSLSNYVPKVSFIPLNLPYVIETFCKYIISLSGALVILNVVPCYALDGQYICHALIELLLRPSVPDPEIRSFIYGLVILFGTILLLVNVVLAMWTLFL
ncbi:membrane-bound transcription factor site-2 protease-like [Physella acuta]|uniref:membrane-bound transcription factor site-2 protease-like n=1 Tax=Physella acuta TaxID=109671 RepID=UPI0027DD1F49|nr:membrane-bound transcription factor site-2 protease-like [Physella acuta]XP_059166352.1 membrane-bound transcription factor site-2 protease-like [Physella acuta]